MHIFSNFLFKQYIYIYIYTVVLSTPHCLSPILYCCCCWCIWVLELHSMSGDATFDSSDTATPGTYPVDRPIVNAMASAPAAAAPKPGAAPQPETEPGFLEGCLDALCCCCRPQDEWCSEYCECCDCCACC